RTWLSGGLGGGGCRGRRRVRGMAEEFGKRNGGENNRRHGGNRKDTVGKTKRLLPQVRGLQTWRLRLRSGRLRLRSGRLRLRSGRRRAGLWHWQLCRGDSGNRGERDSQRRNGLGGGSGDGRGIEARGDF